MEGHTEVTPIIIEDYNVDWPRMFAQISAGLMRTVRALEMPAHFEHAGSTAVEGLAAKPVIDIIGIVPSLDDADRLMVELADHDWVYMSVFESELPTRRYAYLGERPDRVAQLHTYAAGDPEIDRHLAFRDLLRDDEEQRAAYEAHKRELAEQFDDVLAYADAKSAFIRDAEALGLAVWQAAGTEPPAPQV